VLLGLVGKFKAGHLRFDLESSLTLRSREELELRFVGVGFHFVSHRAKGIKLVLNARPEVLALARLAVLASEARLSRR
jgi:hypothetical protein